MTQVKLSRKPSPECEELQFLSSQETRRLKETQKTMIWSPVVYFRFIYLN